MKRWVVQRGVCERRRFFRRVKLMLKAIHKWFVIRSYARRLPRVLLVRYGPNEFYTPAQVTRTIEVHKFNATWIAFAYCMYCRYSDVVTSHREAAENWSELRSEIIRRFFRGRKDFNPSSFFALRQSTASNLNDTLDTTYGDAGAGDI